MQNEYIDQWHKAFDGVSAFGDSANMQDYISEALNLEPVLNMDVIDFVDLSEAQSRQTSMFEIPTFYECK